MFRGAQVTPGGKVAAGHVTATVPVKPPLAVRVIAELAAVPPAVAVVGEAAAVNVPVPTMVTLGKFCEVEL